jgi:hypothetical protein
LISAGGIIQEGRLERWNVTQTNEFLALGTNVEPPESIQMRLRTLWPQLTKALIAAVDARGRERTDSVRKQLADRSEDEVKKITAVMRELEAAIRKEIEGPRDNQLSLFTETELDQEQRNRDALIVRLAELPAEIVRETDIIRARYADPQPRLFPVAVTFLVPEGMG